MARPLIGSLGGCVAKRLRTRRTRGRAMRDTTSDAIKERAMHVTISKACARRGRGAGGFAAAVITSCPETACDFRIGRFCCVGPRRRGRRCFVLTPSERHKRVSVIIRLCRERTCGGVAQGQRALRSGNMPGGIPCGRPESPGSAANLSQTTACAPNSAALPGAGVSAPRRVPVRKVRHNFARRVSVPAAHAAISGPEWVALARWVRRPTAQRQRCVVVLFRSTPGSRGGAGKPQGPISLLKMSLQAGRSDTMGRRGGCANTGKCGAVGRG
jgi:hypothetical protein